MTSSNLQQTNRLTSTELQLDSSGVTSVQTQQPGTINAENTIPKPVFKDYGYKNYLRTYVDRDDAEYHVEKYRALADESNPEVTKFVQDEGHDYRKESSRRRKYATAAKYYAEANKKICKNNLESSKSAFSSAQAELEVLDIRLKAMRYAAEASAKDKPDELLKKSQAESKIALAKLNIIERVEYQYHEWLKGESVINHEDLITSYQKMMVLKPAILKKLEKANKDIVTNYMNTSEVSDWQHRNVLIAKKERDQAFDEDGQYLMFHMVSSQTNMDLKNRPFMKKYLGKTNSENYRLEEGDDGRLLVSCMKTVLIDQNGKPLIPSDREKIDWNNQWFSTFDDEFSLEEQKKEILKKSKENNWSELYTTASIEEVEKKQRKALALRRDMYKQYIDNLMKQPLPTPDELEKDPMTYLKNHYAELTELSRWSITVDNQRRKSKMMDNLIEELTKKGAFEEFLKMTVPLSSIIGTIQGSRGIKISTNNLNVFIKNIDNPFYLGSTAIDPEDPYDIADTLPDYREAYERYQKKLLSLKRQGVNS